ncbi:hypothetical protein CR513_29523, partial [Mucuna pruriens]
MRELDEIQKQPQTIAPLPSSDLKQNDLIVITIEVANFAVKKVLIDQGNSDDILYIDLFTTFGDPSAFRTISVRYLVLEVDTSYNVLIGCLALNALGVIVSTHTWS